MRSIRIEFHSNSTGGSELRLFNDSGKLVDRRPVNAESLELLLHQTNVEYKFPFREQLLDLGQDLYDFLDGQEKWLSREQAASRKSLLVRIDTQGRLSHLPWELLRNQGVYLCPLSHGALLPVRQVGVEVQSLERANRALRLFFMASDPIDTKVPLSFEEEEARILQATQKVPLEIEVEESGSLAGLKDRWYYFGEDHFDILHLVGHAKGGGIKGPVFIMEDDEGYSDPITPERLLSVFGEQWPKLIFVSGCETGKAQASGALLSFCERLAQAGAPAVLGWALPVRDGTAMQVAQEIYSNLSYGRTADQALLEARVAVYESERESERLGKYENWHLLRLYCDGTALGSYVTPQASGHVKFAPRPPAERVFLDAQEQKKEICSRQRFVGRRRFIQRGLRTLRAAVDSMDYAEGVLLQGMGGLGKTSLAVRLCERLPHRRFVNVGQFNEEKLLGLLSRNLETSDAIETLQQPGLPFETRLRLLLKGPLHQKPAIIVLDDFEDNIEMSSDGRTPLQIEGQSLCTLQPAPLETLKALLRAIRESGSDTRLLITCRYDLMVPGPATLRVERLQGFQGVELNKKLSQLDYLNEQFGRSDELKQKVLNLAAGNARLMERLDRVIVSSASDAKRVLFAMEDTSQEFREEILLENLIEQQPVTSKRLLAILSLLHLPIPWTLFEEIAETPEARALLARSTALGLVEIGQKVKGEEEAIYVSSLLGPLLHDAFNDASRREMQARASQVLDQAQWRNVSIYWETRSREVLRLALEGRNNETAATVGSDLVHGLNNQSRYREAALLSEQVSKTLIDYRVLMAWGRSETVLGDTESALEHFEESLRKAPPIDARDHDANKIVGATLNNLANAIAQQGDIPRAMSLWEQSLQIEESIGNQSGIAITLHQMAGIVAQQGNIPRAMNLWEQALQIHKDIGDAKGEAATLHNIAGIVAQLGDIQRALKLWEQALQIHKDIGDAKGKAATLHQMAGIVAQLGDIQRATRLWEQSLQIGESIGDQSGMAATLHQMAGIVAQLGNIPRAMKLWEQALQIHKDIGDAKGKAATLSNMAEIIAQRGDIPRAMKLWNQSLQIKEDIGDAQGKAATLHQMAGIVAQLGDIQRAMSLWERSLQIHEDIGDAQGEAATLHQMAGIVAQLGDIQRAMSLWKQSLQIKEDIGDAQGKAATLSNMAEIVAQQGDIPRAMSLWEQSLQIHEDIGDAQGKAATLHQMAGIVAQLG
ncbi:MAG: tetratricopeptide repeat protein, partial [Acidobacteriota bacterium]